MTKEQTILVQLYVIIMTINIVQPASLKKLILNEILYNSTYDNQVHPGQALGNMSEGFPTNVSVQLFITDLYDVNVNEMDISFTCYLRQYWIDHRLQFNHSNITLELFERDISNVWTPDTVFSQAKKGELHKVTKPNVLFHIKSDGSVTYSLRLTVKLSCTMSFENYPLDKQTCLVNLESYGLTSKELLYTWVPENPVVLEHQNLPLYRLDRKPSSDTKLCHTSLFDGGDGFSCLLTTLTLSRSIGYYMIEIFIPDILVIVLSWVSFWFHPLAVPGRVTLGVVTVLTMSSQGSAARRNSPRVSYVKAVDIWGLFQTMFVFAALIEFSLVNVMARIKITEEQITKTENGMANGLQKNESSSSPTRESQGNVMDPDRDERRRPYIGRAKRIDKLSRIIFPALYLFFNFVFWVSVSSVAN